MPLSADAANQDKTTSRILNKLNYAFANQAADVTTAATGDLIPILDASDAYAIKYADATNIAEVITGQTVAALTVTTLTATTFNTTTPSIGGTAVSSTAAELNYLDQNLASNILTRGAGVDTAESYVGAISRSGGLIVTTIVIDVSTLIQAATDLDIIGETGAASCHWGQITTAKSGTLIGGQVTCLEVPAGGSADIDFYSSNVSTGTQDVIITDAALGTETALVTSGGSWASGTVKGMTGLPTANDYIYLTSGAAAGGTLSAGKFKIEFFGV
jgi:hypothetical protein